MNLSHSSKYNNDDHPGSIASHRYARHGALPASTASVNSRKMMGRKTGEHHKIPLSPIRRATTSATWSHSSCSSSSPMKSEICHNHHSPIGIRRYRRSRPTPGSPARESSRQTRRERYFADVDDDFGSLSRLSLQYREGCLSMDEGQYDEGSVGNSESNSFRTISSAALERFLVSLETLREAPVFPASDTSLRSTNKIMLLPKRSRHYEPLSDADRKPAAKKKAPPSSPFQPPPRRQLKCDPLNAEPSLQRRRSGCANTPPYEDAFTSTSSPSSWSDQKWSTREPEPEEVLRQQAILDDIERERRRAEVHGVPTVSTLSGSSPRLPPTVSVGARRPPENSNTTPVSQGAMTNRPRRTSRNDGSTGRAKTGPVASSSVSTMSLVDDRVASLGNGKKVRLKGTKHAYQSILQGRATIVQCPGCHIMLQISASAKNLYCTGCHQVSSMDVLLHTSAATSGSGSATTSTTVRGSDRVGHDRNCHAELDDRIAHALQRQEIHVSQTAKRAKA